MKRRYRFVLDVEIDDASDVNGRDDERRIKNILRCCESDIQRGVRAKKHPNVDNWIVDNWTLTEIES